MLKIHKHVLHDGFIVGHLKRTDASLPDILLSKAQSIVTFKIIIQGVDNLELAIKNWANFEPVTGKKRLVD
jgi:hypothetical protein